MTMTIAMAMTMAMALALASVAHAKIDLEFPDGVCKPFGFRATISGVQKDDWVVVMDSAGLSSSASSADFKPDRDKVLWSTKAERAFSKPQKWWFQTAQMERGKKYAIAVCTYSKWRLTWWHCKERSANVKLLLDGDERCAARHPMSARSIPLGIPYSFPNIHLHLILHSAYLEHVHVRLDIDSRMRARDGDEAWLKVSAKTVEAPAQVVNKFLATRDDPLRLRLYIKGVDPRRGGQGLCPVHIRLAKGKTFLSFAADLNAQGVDQKHKGKTRLSSTSVFDDAEVKIIRDDQSQCSVTAINLLAKSEKYTSKITDFVIDTIKGLTEFYADMFFRSLLSATLQNGCFQSHWFAKTHDADADMDVGVIVHYESDVTYALIKADSPDVQQLLDASMAGHLGVSTTLKPTNEFAVDKYDPVVTVATKVTTDIIDKLIVAYQDESRVARISHMSTKVSTLLAAMMAPLDSDKWWAAALEATPGKNPYWSFKQVKKDWKQRAQDAVSGWAFSYKPTDWEPKTYHYLPVPTIAQARKDCKVERVEQQKKEMAAHDQQDLLDQHRVSVTLRDGETEVEHAGQRMETKYVQITRAMEITDAEKEQLEADLRNHKRGGDPQLPSDESSQSDESSSEQRAPSQQKKRRFGRKRFRQMFHNDNALIEADAETVQSLELSTKTMNGQARLWTIDYFNGILLGKFDLMIRQVQLIDMNIMIDLLDLKKGDRGVGARFRRHPKFDRASENAVKMKVWLSTNHDMSLPIDQIDSLEVTVSIVAKPGDVLFSGGFVRNGEVITQSLDIQPIKDSFRLKVNLDRNRRNMPFIKKVFHTVIKGAKDIGIALVSTLKPVVLPIVWKQFGIFWQQFGRYMMEQPCITGLMVSEGRLVDANIGVGYESGAVEFDADFMHLFDKNVAVEIPENVRKVGAKLFVGYDEQKYVKLDLQSMARSRMFGKFLGNLGVVLEDAMTTDGAQFTRHLLQAFSEAHANHTELANKFWEYHWKGDDLTKYTVVRSQPTLRRACSYSKWENYYLDLMANPPKPEASSQAKDKYRTSVELARVRMELHKTQLELMEAVDELRKLSHQRKLTESDIAKAEREIDQVEREGESSVDEFVAKKGGKMQKNQEYLDKTKGTLNPFKLIKRGFKSMSNKHNGKKLIKLKLLANAETQEAEDRLSALMDKERAQRKKMTEITVRMREQQKEVFQLTEGR
eukprot:TRINITY_DN65857_c4_g2_i1.p1 TRINITY_DN65857_c4_g2~~TRINITY_DN65857_c4_g2_i1.p1  ORF type:complete len:1211 (-),score=755.70 TRINITY_DN65857_c4_g2_i1:1168-4764(-)